MRKPFFKLTRTLPGFPHVYRTWTQEVEKPFRRSRFSVVMRLPLRRGLVFGVWGEPQPDEDSALIAALGRPEPWRPGDADAA